MSKSGPKSGERRGVLLLVVLSMLVLFVLVGITFVVLAGQWRRSSYALNRNATFSDDPKDELDDIFNTIVRGTNNPQSALYTHEILGDLYGLDGVSGTLTAAPTSTTVQFINLPVTSTAGLNSTPGFYNGCVLTMLDGPAAGRSTRIVGYDGSATVRVMAFDGLPTSALLVPPATYNPVGNRFLINGRPFNGTGFGYNQSTGLNNATDSSTPPRPLALMPHARYLPGGPLSASLGGTNEDHDAVTPDDMALSMVPPNVTSSNQIIPSFHRPELVRYWASSFAGDANLPRRVILRPLQTDHPQFTGSNPYFDPTAGASCQWDVDNDGDGIADSIWIDVGLPVRTTADGRQYKALAAVLCMDMDGKLNLNAHGSLEQIQTAYNGQVSGPFAGGNGPSNINLPRGQGYGPAEINLMPLFASSGGTNAYQQLLIGTGSLEGRYGELINQNVNARPGISFNNSNTPPDDRLSLIKHYDYPYSYYSGTPQFTSFGTPPDLWGRAAIGLDFRGQPLFQFPGYTAPNPNEVQDNPYQIDLSRNATRATGAYGNDSPYTVAELERLLRANDLDANTLPSRLAVLAPQLLQNQGNRNAFTTDSFDLPCPGVLATSDMRAAITATGQFPNGPTRLSLPELLRAKLLQAGLTGAAVTTQMTNMLSPEVIAGQRFDLNRPFGNGRDDNNNGVVDEPQEYSTNSEAGWAGLFPNAPAAGVQFDLNDDGQLNAADAVLARQIYARHLYVLMMLLTDQGYYNWSQEPGLSGNAAQQRELNTRRIAQWAINAVDFRDQDSIMTPFEYDVNPFNGWDVNGNITDGATGNEPGAHPTERRLVWGCEYPDLLLTETGALHDRRVRDTKNDNGVNKKRDEGQGNPNDPTLDQVRIPQGSLFVELYCTRNNSSSQYIQPGDLYAYNSGTGQWQLDLGKLTPDSKYPVWRLAITPYTQSGGNNNYDVGTRLTSTEPDTASLQPKTTSQPDNFSLLPTPNSQAGPIPVERIVWFAPLAPQASTLDADKIYYNQAGAGTPVRLTPGQYAVVGPRATTYIGRSSSGVAPTQLSGQKISLNPNVGVTNSAGASNYPNTGSAIQVPLGIICAGQKDGTTWANLDGQPTGAPPYIGLSVSEPLFSANNYYPRPDQTDPISQQMDSYGLEGDATHKFADTPMDSDSAAVPLRPLLADSAVQTGRKNNYKNVFLQRLADPLSPHDPVSNPYISIDFMPVDLTTFNGEALQTSSPPAWATPFDPDDAAYATPPATMQLNTRQRGTSAGGPANQFNIWSSNPTLQDNIPAVAKGSNNNVFDYNLTHRLGYLNQAFSTPAFPPPISSTDPQGSVNGGMYIGDPQQPFPWITWNNRPWANPLELMNVPASAPQRLLWEFKMNYTGLNAYADGSTPGTYQSPFQHLLNFFETATSTAIGTAPHYYRLLDYVQTPSRFVGTETYLNPSVFTASSPQPESAGFYAPYNRVSRYRDPGKVNINTIFNPAVWQGVLNNANVYGGGPPASEPSWLKLVDSRRGDGANTGSLVTTSTSSPTSFGNPFRSAAGADYVLPGTTARKGVEVTLLRPDPANPQTPLFDFANMQPNGAQAYNNPDRNAYFKYQQLERLSNLVTTRSNVYAIWITVGYFQVLPAPIDAVHPDGFQLTTELGSDTGDIKRHRGFYIFDRSIPVGYERGENHNIGDATLLKRFIE